MKTHQLVQGSPEWVAFRFQHFGASEAAAMLGLSTKMTRTELLHLKHTGNAREFSDFVQERILDAGHRVEALARPILAKRIGEKLYPVTCSEGKLSASCDGLTMGEDIAFEHKQWNQALAEAVAAGELPEEYWPQCQQILMVTKAEKLIFVVSDGTEENFLTREVDPDPAWFERLTKGWEQFAIDLATYEPRTYEAKPVGHTPETLPALLVQVTGAVTASNLDEYKEHALGVIGSINRSLKTDSDFADAEKAVKWCGDVEDRLEQVKQHTLSQTASIETLFRTIDEIAATARSTRLELNTLVTRRKAEVKDEIVLGAKQKYDAHLVSLKAETDNFWIEIPKPDFAGAIKGKRSVALMQDAVDTMLSVYKVAANDSATKIRTNLATLKTSTAGHEFLFNDRAALIAKAPEDLQLVIKTRIADHKAEQQRKEDEDRERLARAAREKAEEDVRVANQAAMGEIQGIQQQVIIAQTGRLGVRKGGTIDCIRETLAETEAWVIDARFGIMQGAAQSAKDTAVAAIRTLLTDAEARAAAPAPAPTPVASPAPATLPFAAVVDIMPPAVRAAMTSTSTAPVAAQTPQTKPVVHQETTEVIDNGNRLTLTQINAKLSPISITAAGLLELDFKHIATNGSAKLYRECDLAQICDALTQHLEAVRETANGELLPA